MYMYIIHVHVHVYYNTFIIIIIILGHVLGVISATDPDEGSNSVVSYTLITDPSDNGLFAIDSNTVRHWHTCTFSVVSY